MSLVILDRDGVINFDSDDYIKSVDEWRPIPGSIEAIAQLSQAGMTIAVATNQSGLSRGLFDLDELEAMHQKLHDLVNDAGGHIDGIFYCPHLPEDHCNCRKPKTGLVDAMETELAVSARGAVLVGDSLKDLQLALAKGALPILVLTGRGTATEAKLRGGELAEEELKQIRIFPDLASTTDFILHAAQF